MNFIKRLLLVCFLCLISTKIKAQNITVDDSKTAESLVKNVLINSSCINIATVQASGNPASTGASYASFSSGTSGFPFSTGIVLSTSASKNAQGPYIEADSKGFTNSQWKGDNDLNKALNNAVSTQATVLEFDFVALTNSISFNYIFASNEYQTYYPCVYSDGFAFLIKEAGTTEDYKNLAVLPDSTVPVASTTVHTKIDPVIVSGQSFDGCEAINENFFNGYNTELSPINYAGQTTVMNARTNVIPNRTYHLKLVIADDPTGQFNSAVFIQGGSFVSLVDFGADRTLANNNPACFGETITLNTQLDNIQYDFKWFKQDATNNYVEIPSQVSSTYNVQSAGNYKVEATLKGTSCVSTGQIKIEYATEITSANTSLLQCDDDTDGITIFNLTKVNEIVKNNASEILNKGYYESLADAQSKTNPILKPEQYTNKTLDQIVFARIENQYGCFTAAEVTLKVSNTTIPDQNPIATCDGDDKQDGLYQFDLAAEVTPQVSTGLPATLVFNYYLNTNDALNDANKLPNIFKNTVAFSQIIYAKATNGADCFDIVPITLVVNTFDPPDFQDETKFLCKGDEITLNVANGFASYLWNTGSTDTFIEVNVAGDYSVVVTDANGCQKTKKFKVILSEPALITEAIIKDFSGIDNSVLLQYSGVGNYEFSLDGNVFQNDPLFTGVKAGIYNAIARDKNGCGLSNSFLLYVVDYPRFFTPNGDGYNDLWFITNIDHLPDYKIYIFDRYGKFLKQMDQNSIGWNGIYNSQQLPADDYWFTLQFVDGKNVKGHFSLKR
ncbi:T9SS type B sorting domain-containing protein [Flavobacterium piscisymbiosum]|uniref:T9SS type B sorting domain-containing protein n=1 Tax=Flavobacterium piscisymbiosum TaxID=2893753 RepID=A0ABS8MMH3_9FLAO|nr:T9SS type B sorting domain-containing protein [Flavobacterium sp. F-30]MCC9066573.1 T9SS type B sorting domain-containing protein [Flavobacterium sp. F-30]